MNTKSIALLLIGIFAIVGIMYIQRQILLLKRNLMTTSKSLEASMDKTGRVTYISELKELKELNLNNVDENICSINLNSELSKTNKIQILALICKELNIEIELFYIKNSTFLICLKKDYHATLMIDSSKITITCEDFPHLLILRKTTLEILKTEKANIIVEG